MFAIEFLSAAEIGRYDEPEAWTLSNTRSSSRAVLEEECKLCDQDADGQFLHRVRELGDENFAEIVRVDRWFEPAKAWVSQAAGITRSVRFVR
jgi:hypothetical protein